MPGPTNANEFLEVIRRSGLVEERRLADYLDRLRRYSSLTNESKLLAENMVHDGLLTYFQAEQLLQGKWKRFSIGHFKVLERLGAGSMGSVYLCECKLLGILVAVKVLPAALSQEPVSVQRFLREARILAVLRHPNIVCIHQVGQDEPLYYLAMEYVEGASLQDMVSKAGPLHVSRACHYIRQAAQALQHAQETARVVHRDIEPENIMVDRNGMVKLIDFGLVRILHELDTLPVPHDTTFLSKADYLAPEQALDSYSVDFRADVYGLGAVFYFLLTGQPPFAEGTIAQKLIWHQTRNPRPIREFRPEVPEKLAAVVERMLAKDPARRYPTAQAVADALAPWTAVPIPPPPEEEMPQLCPLVRNHPSRARGNRATEG
jgi:serine/threonine protein kinase